MSVSAARTAASAWATREPIQRGQILYRLAELLGARTPELLAALSARGSAAARAELDGAVDALVHHAGWADKLDRMCGRLDRRPGGALAVASVEPVGVVGVLAAPGASIAATLAAAAAALAAGNCAVVFGVADPWSLPGLELGALALAVGAPAGVLGLVCESETTGDANGDRVLARPGCDVMLAGDDSAAIGLDLIRACITRRTVVGR